MTKEFEGVVKVKDLDADNIDLIQGSEAVKEFLEASDYINDDEYDYAFIVWDEARSGTVQTVYGSYKVGLEDYAYRLPQRSLVK